jgi:hypothetical protein
MASGVTSAHVPAAAEVLRALETLQIDHGALSPLDDDRVFHEVACTLAEEVDHTHTFNYDPSSSEDLTSALVEMIEGRGFRGSSSSRCAILDFLTAEAQSARLAAHASIAAQAATAERAAKDHLEETGDPAPKVDPDVSLASSLSRMCTAFGIGVDEVAGVETPEDVAALVATISGRIAQEVQAGASLGEPIIDPADVTAMSGDALRECSNVCKALAAEHELRKGLLMRRLDVTIQSFGYSEKATADGFRGVQRGVVRAIEAGEQDIDVYDALVARDWLLDMERVSGDGAHGAVENEVKRMLMGSVPDRGGRVGAAAAAAANMPAFQPRSTAGRGSGRGRGQGRGKGRGQSRKHH